jgi:hypothetical protein
MSRRRHFRSRPVNRLAILAAALALSACADSEEAKLVPIEEDEGYNKIDPVEAAVPQSGELTLGDWSAGTLGDRPALLFGPAGTAPLFSLRCDDREGLLLQRHGVVVAPGEAEMMTITLGASTHRLAVNAVGGTVPMLRAAIPATDDLLAQLRGASGPIMVAVGDGPALNLPSSPQIGGFVQSCAAEPPAPADEPVAADAGAGNAAEPQP